MSHISSEKSIDARQISNLKDSLKNGPVVSLQLYSRSANRFSLNTTENGIGDEGAETIANSFCLNSKAKRMKLVGKKLLNEFTDFTTLGEEIGASGTFHLVEGLKKNAKLSDQKYLAIGELVLDGICQFFQVITFQRIPLEMKEPNTLKTCCSFLKELFTIYLWQVKNR